MSDDLHKYPGNLKHDKVDAPARRKPLLSDEKVMDARAWPPEQVSDFYEAARAKDAELIQRLVDAALYIYWTKPEAAKARMNEVLKAAAAAGFKPSEQ